MKSTTSIGEARGAQAAHSQYAADVQAWSKRSQCAGKLVVALLAFAAFAAPAQSAPPSENPASLPELKVVLRPNVKDGSVDYLDVSLTIGRPRTKAGDTLLRMPLIIVSIPTPRYDGDAIKAHDDAGNLPLMQKDEPPTPSGTYRRWLASRPTVGDVVVNYRAPMRSVSASTRPGPLFDLRAESGGLNGAGIAFLALPNAETSYRIRVHWDLADMPPGSRGVWSFGEGDASTVGKVEVLADTYYAAGPLNSYPSDHSGNYAMYWFGQPSFDVRVVAENIHKFFTFVSKFFGQEEGTYRVFVRKNPYNSGGGTTLLSSFMFGYSDDKPPKPGEMHGLLAHEIVHNWPRVQGDHGATAWYSEGTAEYYSTLLSYRAGVYDAAKFLEEINRHASGYYTNPLRPLTNEQAADRFWSDSRAQRIPYGRGFMYLAQVDAEIREKSGGKRSLDDLVLALHDRDKRGEKYGIPEWLELVTKELGPKASEEYQAMTSGAMLVPPAGSFAPCFAPEKFEEKSFELGFDIHSLEGDRKVRGLLAGSAAAAAGVREGDVIVDASRLSDAQDDPAELMHLKVRRGTEELTISYPPRGKTVPSYHWVRAPNVPDSACRL